MQIILFGYIGLDNRTVSLMEVCEHLQQLFIRLINPPYQVAHLIFFEVFGKSFQTALHELVDLNGVVVLVAAMNGQT